MAIIQHTISVWVSQNDYHMRNMFRCIRCGKVVGELTGQVRALMQGEVGGNGLIVRCHNKVPTEYGSAPCGTEYIFYL